MADKPKYQKDAEQKAKALGKKIPKVVKVKRDQPKGKTNPPDPRTGG